MKMIDADRLSKRILEVAYELDQKSQMRSGMIFANKLVCDEQDVGLERQAEWLTYDEENGADSRYKICSRCHYIIHNGITDKYCPSCGALMYGEPIKPKFWIVRDGKRYCSECGHEALWIYLGDSYGEFSSPYCPSCGARMNGVSNNG